MYDVDGKFLMWTMDGVNTGSVFCGKGNLVQLTFMIDQTEI